MPSTQDKTVASVDVLGLASVQALHADCALDANTGTINGTPIGTGSGPHP